MKQAIFELLRLQHLKFQRPTAWRFTSMLSGFEILNDQALNIFNWQVK